MRPEYDHVRDAHQRMVDAAERLNATLMRTAEALEWSARLAEEHAQREAHRGVLEAAAKERDIAYRARAAAQHARTRAARPN